MIESFKKGIKVGIGLATRTAEEIEDRVKAFAKSKDVPSPKAKRLAKDIVRTVKKEKAAVKRKLSKSTKEKLRRLHRVSQVEADKFLAQMLEWQIEVEDLIEDGSDKALQKAKKLHKKSRAQFKKLYGQHLKNGLDTILEGVLKTDVIPVRDVTPKKKAQRKSTKKKGTKKKVSKKKSTKKKPSKKK